ncbi:MAG: LysM peptidoglycan-binding domain-containing protein [Ilumatobacter sp.]
MNTATIKTITIDHRTGFTSGAGRVSSYQRVSRPQRNAPNYAARRLGALFMALSAVLAGVWMVEQAVDGFAGTPVVAAEDVAIDDVLRAPGVHVARNGDSLWSIADEYRSDVARDRYVDALIALNGGTTVLAGQAVRLP